MIVEHNQSSFYDNKWKFNGKELDDATGMYYYGARYYDPRISIFVSVDPLAEKTMEPYLYTGNNPIMFTDPTGMAKDGVETDYTLDRKTGEVKQHGETNNEPDRIVKIKKNGETKVKIDNIAKGILKDGMNLRMEDNLIDVNGENQPKTEDVEYFAVKLQQYVRREIGGTYVSDKEDSKAITHIAVGNYNKNKYNNTKSSGLSIIFRNKFTAKNIRGFFHTHPQGRIPSRADLEIRNNGLERNPDLFYNILTPIRPGESGRVHRTNYTTGYGH